MRRLLRDNLRVMLAVVALALLALFIWPTRYKYDHTNISGRRLLVRVDRLTSATRILTENGWQAPGASRPESDQPRTVQPEHVEPDELAKIQGWGGIHPDSLSLNSNPRTGRWECSFYNGSELWVLKSVTVVLKMGKYSRKYMLQGTIPPLSSRTLSARLDQETMLQWWPLKMRLPKSPLCQHD